MTKTDAAEERLVAITTLPTESDLWVISANATARKNAIFKEMGFEQAGSVSEGDVRCVLNALRSYAESQAKGCSDE